MLKNSKNFYVFSQPEEIITQLLQDITMELPSITCNNLNYNPLKGA